MGSEWHFVPLKPKCRGGGTHTSSEPAGVLGDPNRVETVARAELADRIRQIIAHRRRRKVETLADLFGRSPDCEARNTSAPRSVSGVAPVSTAAATSSGSSTRIPAAMARATDTGPSDSKVRPEN